MSNSSTPLAVSVRPDPFLLERVVTGRQVAAVLDPPGNGNGNGSNGNHNGGSANHNETPIPPETRPLQAGTPWMMGYSYGRAVEGRPPVEEEPKEIDFAPAVPAPVEPPNTAPSPSVVPNSGALPFAATALAAAAGAAAGAALGAAAAAAAAAAV
ncbi:MAG: hypothetical protein ACRD3W_32530, partial [Terriglobales bacterium]